jgi:MerR family transcriptional regulator, light-induced transcriptional regulator
MQLREAADALGVHYQTAYAWVRQGVLPARKLGRGYEVNDGDVRALAAQRQLGGEPTPKIQVHDWAAPADRLYSAIVTGDETQARQRIERLAAGVAVMDLCQRVIAPAMRHIGDDWAAGRVSIAEEHRASAICERLIALHTRQPAGRPRGTVVVTTPPGERHSLPALMAAATLREDRWLVHHLAADLPFAEVTRLAQDVRADLAVLSAATQDTGRRAMEATSEIAAACPGLDVLIGLPGDRLDDLRRFARDMRESGAGQGDQPDAPGGADRGPDRDADRGGTRTMDRGGTGTMDRLPESAQLP